MASATTKMSSKGQVIIPKPLRDALKWQPGLKLQVIDTGNGVLLRPAKHFLETSLQEVAGCLKYPGKAKTLADMKDAMRKGAQKVMKHD